jgi:two-component system, NtrC family, response regulator AtoC
MSFRPQILVVDDQQNIRLTLETGLSLNGFRVRCAKSGREALECATETRFDAVVCDIFMPDGDGISVIKELRSLRASMPIILMTAQGSVELAVRAVAEGATEFIAKPFEVREIANLLRRHLAAVRESGHFSEDSATTAEEISPTGLVGRSPAMVAVYRLIAKAARTDVPVLITGESGTGKELVARAIHDFSNRKKAPFLAVNCSGLTETLLESELFGYTRGAFTGAVGEKSGLFEAADCGTIFLDELASTSPGFQASLLRVLQSGEVRRVGSTQTRRVNVRIIGASNASLREMAVAGQFRPDLFYRLSVLSIELPPLCKRQDDLELLAEHFLRMYGQEAVTEFRLSREALESLKSYPFPGNVRELENAMRRAVTLCPTDIITTDCLPPEITSFRPVQQGSERGDLIADRPTIDELQRRYLQLVLEENQGRKTRAAEILGLDRRTVQRLAARYRLTTLPDPESEPSEDPDGCSDPNGESS